MMGQNKTLTLVRNGTSIGTFKGDVQEVGMQTSADKNIGYMGYFAEAYLSAPIGTDIQSKDRVRYYIGANFTEYIVQSVVKENNGMGRHIEATVRLNPLYVTSNLAEVKKLSVIESNYNEILDESYGTQYYTSSTIVGVVKSNKTTEITEGDGGRIVRNTLMLMVNAGDVLWSDTLQIGQRVYKVQEVVETEFDIDIVEIFEIKK